jgi:hypothetical protein
VKRNKKGKSKKKDKVWWAYKITFSLERCFKCKLKSTNGLAIIFLEITKANLTTWQTYRRYQNNYSESILQRNAGGSF